MTQDEIIEMAIGIGLKYRKDNNEIYTPYCDGIHIDELRLFSELVAQHEREACAMVCENLVLASNGGMRAAIVIRARGQA